MKKMSKSPVPSTVELSALPTGQAKYKVITDRNPFWNGRPLSNGEYFMAEADNPAVIAMLSREWIIPAGSGKK